MFSWYNTFQSDFLDVHLQSISVIEGCCQQPAFICCMLLKHFQIPVSRNGILTSNNSQDSVC